jgi:sulfur transfer protein SufE
MITEIRKRISCLFAMSLTVSVAAAADIAVSDGGVNDIVGNTTWTSDNVYLLEGRVFVEAGETLTIEPGVVIKGKPGSNENASALVVARGGKIFAEGTAADPIIFTAEADDMGDPFDLGPTDRGRWGGLIVLGAATLNSPAAAGSPIMDNIEGIPTSEPRGQFGGSDDNDNSGVIRYVSIRHGGVSIGSNNEINGLTLGGVGRGTTVEFVEVYANLDDGVEFFGGTVGVKHAVVSYCGDDSFDYDQGWRGKGQFWLTIGDNAMDNGGEHDGDVDDFTKLPLSNPLIYNVTYIGPGSGAGTGGDALRMRENAAGKYYNSIFTGFGDQAVRVDSNAGARVTAGDLDIQQSLFFDFGAGSTAADIASTDAQVFFTDMAKGNAISDPMLMGIGRIFDAADAFDPRLQGGSPALMAGLDEPGDGFFNDVSFKGAFDGTVNWASAWTIMGATDLISEAGAAEPNYALAQGQTITLIDGGANDIQGNAVWRKGNTYLLEGRVFVEAGETLTIEPGVVIKGKPGSNENASALVVARGGKIFAEGTAADPIIFTAEADDLGDPFDLGPTDRGRWGGLIVLGAATLNSPAAAGSPIMDNIEGIPTSEPRGQFGGSNDDDNSGVIRYVSIRHGGVSIGSNNEINGLTLGGVGRGTTVEFIEVYANLDDGVEFFGGTVGVKYAVVTFCGDDSFDYDQGWRGKGQFWFTIGDNAMDNGGEHDGDVDDFTKTPFSNPTIYNVTYVGPGSGAGTGGDALRMRENAGGKYYNSIFTGFGDQAVRVDSNAAARVAAGDLDIAGNIFFDFGAGSTATDIASADALVFFTDMSKANQIVDPMLGGLDINVVFGLDPRPAMASPAFAPSRVAPAGDDFFVQANFVGAFGVANWAAGWTILNESEFLTSAGMATPVPLELGFTPALGKLTLGFATGAGITYQLQSSPNAAGPWTDVGVSVSGDGAVHIFDAIIGIEPSLFFRIVEQ